MCVFALVAFDGGATTFITGVQLMGASICASFLCYVTMHDLSHVCGVYTYPCMYMYIGVYSHIYIYTIHICIYIFIHMFDFMYRDSSFVANNGCTTT
jgi:hypothetical protein